ncbi:MAG TPA: TIR domain-containing protein [Sphingomicrobium sp.]|nr:TIR domain-containing protein [Sphingomicrobium sp.]
MHVFLSYARSSEEQATYAEQALRNAGYAVWRDTELPAHLSYADVIEERLKSAKAVLVLWSAEAAKSQWVRAEADAARELGTLIQASVDGTVPPIPFNQIQCADLKGWAGDNDHAGWRKLRASVVALAGQAEEPVKSTKRQRPTSSICVLPFQNMSGDDVPDYFSDGISEDIISDLSKVRALSVIPRKTAFEFKGQEVDPWSVAEKLGVSYVLEGAVRRAGDRVRITAQLIDGDTGEQAWSDRYYRDFTDVFSVQDEISKAIVDALKIKLLPAKKKAVEDEETSTEEGSARTQNVPQEGSLDEPHSAFHFDSQDGETAEQEVEVQETHVSAADGSFDEHNPEVAPNPGEEWNEEWNSSEDWDSDEDRRRDFLAPGLLPRLIGLGLVFLVVAGIVGATYWPSQPAPVAEPQEEVLTYTITSSVYVRTLPTRKGSRVLGKLEPGDTINIVPSLAGAQPDWVKIKDGPYVGGYVWRESTKPTSGSSNPDGSNTIENSAAT